MQTGSKFTSANEMLGNNVEVLLEKLNLEYKVYGKKILLACPVHGGDNKDACAIYINSDVPNWKCWTHGCHTTVGKSLVSFVKGVKGYTIDQVISWTENNFGELKVNYESRFNINVNTLIQKRKTQPTTISKTELLQRIVKPASFYLKKGFKRETLDKYDVGLGTKAIDYMYNRVIVPVFNDTYEECVGVLGRTLYDKCILCNGYHDYKSICPVNKTYNNFSKWKNSPGFYCNSYLYNYWFAKDFIKKTGIIILVEGQADVWKCYEAGINNVVGIFGNTLTEDQQMIIESSGAQKIISFLDPDKGGVDGALTIKKYAESMFNYENIIFDKEPADCTNEELDSILGDYQ